MTGSKVEKAFLRMQRMRNVFALASEFYFKFGSIDVEQYLVVKRDYLAAQECYINS